MYVIRATEERNEKANEYETKSLLFLMDYYKQSESIAYFAIDFFNDLSGINEFATECYDVQSKGVKNISPKELGEYLVTLFRNYLSDLNFVNYFLCIDSVNPVISREIGDKKVFLYSDLSNDIKIKIKAGLIDAVLKKQYLDSTFANDNVRILDFLDNIMFVICDKSKEQYVKDAVDYNVNLVDDKYFRKLFKEIRDFQSAKKNNNLEGTEISSIACLFQYDKYISLKSIRSLIISKMV